MKKKISVRVVDEERWTHVYYGDRELGTVFGGPTVWVAIGHSTYHVKSDYKPFQNRNEGIAFILDKCGQS